MTAPRSHRLVPSRPWLLLALGAALLPGCRNRNSQTVPNRALDRPMDAELACVQRRADGTMGVAPAGSCAGSNPSCSDPDSPHLVGFVTNSERDEIGVFRRCDRNGLVDMDPESPGYDFLPAGGMPQELTITEDACRAVAANTQSCDLSVVDVPLAAGRALQVQTDQAAGSMAWSVIPLRGDGTALGARPGDILAVPGFLSQVGDAGAGGGQPILGGGFERATDGGSGSGGGGSTGGGGGTGGGGLEFPACDADAPYSVYVTFPSCQLVAEVSLTTGQILQSRQLVPDGSGSFDVVDTGTNPACPSECPEQVSPGAPEPPELAGGPSPATLSLALARIDGVEPEDYDAADEDLVNSGYHALFVAGPGSDEILEIPLDESGWFAPSDSNRLQLADAEGIHRLRVSPPVTLTASGLGAATRQFIYAVAGDGTTRVVQREWELPFELGVECDTQRDPATLFQDEVSECSPVDPQLGGDPPARRPLAVGPGIRAPGGATFTDWMFHKIRPVDLGGVEGTPDLANPFGAAGMVGVGTTSFGRVVLTLFGQTEGLATTVPTRDPVGLMDVSLSAHNLWPLTNPHADGADSALPRVGDDEPAREIPGEATGTKMLAPTLRRIDLGYALSDLGNLSAEQELLAASFGDPQNVDQLGSFQAKEDSGRLYENPVPRVHARDYRSWTSGAWAMVWEGIIPNTTSSTGRLECDFPGWQDGTCLAPPAGYVPDLGGGTCPSCDPGFTCDAAANRCVAECLVDDDCAALAASSGLDLACDTVRGGCRLSDEARARATRITDEGAAFCDDGVLAGDKLVLLGCEDDGDCGVGQVCLTDPAGANGLCVSESEFAEAEAELRQVCAPFLRDSCGPARREFLITRATQEELWLQSLDIPEQSYLVDVDLPDAPNDPFPAGEVAEQFARWTCILPEGASQPSGGCDSTDDCAELGEDYVCIEGLCRISCEKVPEVVPGYEGVDACRLTPLPGPRCFQEFLRYQVRLQNSFLVTGTPVGAFFPDRVKEDPDTGECVEDPTVSPLLTSRLRLGRDEEETFTHPVWGIPDCPSDEVGPADPNPCRVVRPRSDDPSTRFHTFRFRDTADIAAVRFSNPFVSFVVDLVSLRDLGSFIPGREEVWREDTYAPPQPDIGPMMRSFTQFYRARIPQPYRETFEVIAGYIPINDPVNTANVPMVYPVHIMPAPEFAHAFVVDAGGRGGPTGIRGQVIRLILNPAPIRGDENFRVR